MLEINQHRSIITASFDDGNSLTVAMNQIVFLGKYFVLRGQQIQRCDLQKIEDVLNKSDRCMRHVKRDIF